ncbi:hypothetical protein [Leifsonia sp. NPDC058248]|uniref:hypothetical protein n=1 Tax=Leifsonia sp. NPDC058248 TaxID=3346402 RepID=UPI0036DF77BE
MAVAVLLATPPVLALGACTTSSGEASSTSEVRQKYPTPMDLAQARAECLNDRGWGVKVNENAEIEAAYPSNRQSEYEADNRQCLVELGIDPDAPTSEAIVVDAYRIYKDGANCLSDAGWDISDSPSLQKFKDTYESDPWYPWSEVPEQDATEALKLCPGPEPTY